jgi:hypothetical protein
MEPRRRIFWMLSNAVMALIFSNVSALITVLLILTTSIWISHNAMVLTVEGRAE